MIKAILFDFDGTLVDTNGVIIASWHHVYDTLNLPHPELSEIVKTFGENLFKSMEEAFPNMPVEESVRIYRDYMHSCFKDKVYMFEGIGDLVTSLHKKGFKLAIVTSRHWGTFNTFGYDFPIEKLFDTIVSGEDYTAFKPDPQPCNIALERLNVKPEEAIMVGDSRLDILCGKNASCHTALVAWSLAFSKEKAVGIYKPDGILEKPTDLFSLIDELNKI